MAAAKGEVATITKELSTSQMSLQRIQPKFERISVRFVLGALRPWSGICCPNQGVCLHRDFCAQIHFKAANSRLPRYPFSRPLAEHAANLMRQDVGNEKLDMYSAVLMYLVADKKTAGFVQKGVFALVQKSHPVRSRTTWPPLERLQHCTYLARPQHFAWPTSSVWCFTDMNECRTLKCRTLSLALRVQGTPLKDVKRALEDLLRHANQPHHDIINDVFSVRYPDLVFQTTLQLAVFEAICREIGVDYRTVLKEALAPEAGGAAAFWSWPHSVSVVSERGLSLYHLSHLEPPGPIQVGRWVRG